MAGTGRPSTFLPDASSEGADGVATPRHDDWRDLCPSMIHLLPDGPNNHRHIAFIVAFVAKPVIASLAIVASLHGSSALWQRGRDGSGQRSKASPRQLRNRILD
jgi:hypothetical protein